MQLAGPVTIESEVGGKCSLQLPPTEGREVTVTTVGGAAVVTTREGGRWNFQTQPGAAYVVAPR